LLQYKWQLQPSNWIPWKAVISWLYNQLSPNLVWLLRPCYSTTFLTSWVTHDNKKFNSKRHLYLDFEQILSFRRSIVISCRLTMENILLCIKHCVNILCVRLKNRKYYCQKLTRVQTFVCFAHQTAHILNCLHHRRMTLKSYIFICITSISPALIINI